MSRKIYVSDGFGGDGEFTPKQAVELMTDDWICGGNASHQTLMDTRDALKAAQQNVQRTAIAAGGLAFFAGIVIGWLAGVR